MICLRCQTTILTGALTYCTNCYTACKNGCLPYPSTLPACPDQPRHDLVRAFYLQCVCSLPFALKADCTASTKRQTPCRCACHHKTMRGAKAELRARSVGKDSYDPRTPKELAALKKASEMVASTLTTPAILTAHRDLKMEQVLARLRDSVLRYPDFDPHGARGESAPPTSESDW